MFVEDFGRKSGGDCVPVCVALAALERENDFDRHSEKASSVSRKASSRSVGFSLSFRIFFHIFFAHISQIINIKLRLFCLSKRVDNKLSSFSRASSNVSSSADLLAVRFLLNQQGST